MKYTLGQMCETGWLVLNKEQDTEWSAEGCPVVETHPSCVRVVSLVDAHGHRRYQQHGEQVSL